MTANIQIDILKYQTDPFLHQRKALEKSFDMKSFALLMEQGTGKTKVAIDTGVNLYLKGEITAMLIVAPSGVDYAWIEKEIPAHLLDGVIVHTYLHRSATAKHKREVFKRRQFLEDKSECLKILIMMPESLLTALGESLARSLIFQNSVLMIVDESGRLLKNHKSQRTKKLISLGKQVSYRRILTGTPVTKNPLDLYPQFYFLDPDILGYNNWYSFKNRYAVEQVQFAGARSFLKITGYQNIEELIEKISKHSFRVLKKDCLDLPDKIYKKQFYQLNSEQLKIYVDLKNDSVAFPGIPTSDESLLELILNGTDSVTAENALKKLLRLQQILSGVVPLESGTVYNIFDSHAENPRIQALNEALEDASEKVIIWCRFTHEIKTLCEYFSKNSVGYFGEMTARDREESFCLFKAEKSIRFLIANQSMGTGWTMNEATTVIYYSNSFNLEHRLQSEDRCHRIGQKNNVTYIDIIAEQTIDEHILRNLQQKMHYSQMLDNLNK